MNITARSIRRLLLNPVLLVVALAAGVIAIVASGAVGWGPRFIVALAVVAVSGAVALTFVGLGLGFPRQLPIAVGDDDEVVDVLGSRLRYRWTPGEGPVVLLVHGNNLSIDDWNPMAALLGGRNLVAVDLVGYAGSDRPADLAYDKECQHRYLIAFMDALGIERAVLVGHSMGGTVVGWAAAKSPERVIASVLIAPPGIPGSLVYAWPKSLLCRPGRLNRIAFRIAASKPFRRAFPLTLARQGLGITGSYDDAYADALREIETPMQLIWSSGDPRCLVEYVDVYRRRVSDLDVRIVDENVGHMVPMADPSLTAELVADFLDRFTEEPSDLTGSGPGSNPAGPG